MGTAQTEDFETAYTYDAAGRQITRSIKGDGLILQLSSNAYDLAGRLVTSADAAGLITTYTYDSVTRSETYSGGGTSVSISYADGHTISITGTAVVASHFTYGVNADGSQWTKTYTGPDGTNSAMWSKTTVDMLGRLIKTEKAGQSVNIITNEFCYAANGQLIRSTAPEMADRLYQYNELGEQVLSGLDADDSEDLSLAGIDRIVGTETFYSEEGGIWYRKTISTVYAATNGTATTNSISKVRLTGLGIATNGALLTAESVFVDIHGNESIARTFTDRDNKTVTRSTALPGTTNTIDSVSINGLVTSNRTASGNTYTYGYDDLRRRSSVVDPRTGLSTTGYNSLGQIAWTADPAGNTNYFAYDASTGLRAAVTNALNQATYYSHNENIFSVFIKPNSFESKNSFGD